MKYAIILLVLSCFTGICFAQNVSVVMAESSCPSCQTAVLNFISSNDTCKEATIIMLGYPNGTRLSLLKRTNTYDFPRISIRHASDLYAYFKPTHMYVIDDRRKVPVVHEYPPGDPLPVIEMLRTLIDCKE